MPTAREQARRAAANARPVEPGFYDIPSKCLISTDDSTKMADAASDVWEPLLRDLLERVPNQDVAIALNRTQFYHVADCACTQLLSCPYHEAIRRATEALG